MKAQATPAPFAMRLRSALFDITAREPEQAPRLMLRIIALLFAGLFLWTVFAQLDIVAVAHGRLVPRTYVKVVQPAEAGIVREILVREGDQVQQGQVLARLDATENTADRAATERELQTQQLQVRRVEAELAGATIKRLDGDEVQLFAQVDAQRAAHRQQFLDSLAQEEAARDRATRELVAAEEVLRKLEKTLPSYQRTADAYQKLSEQNLVGEIQAEEKTREAVEKAQDFESQSAVVEGLRAAISQSEKRLAQLKSSYESELHAIRLDASSKITQLEQQQAKLHYYQEHLELKAPQAGTIKDLATTTVGAVVQPGTVLITLVPAHEPLLAEVSIENSDIGFVREGHPVRLKLATYPFQKYGMLEGVVKTVIADSSATQGDRQVAGASEDLEPTSLSYKAVIELNDQSLRMRDSALPLTAGMQLSAEIVEGKRTVLEYLLSPMQQVASEAGMER